MKHDAEYYERGIEHADVVLRLVEQSADTKEQASARVAGLVHALIGEYDLMPWQVFPPHDAGDQQTWDELTSDAQAMFNSIVDLIGSMTEEEGGAPLAIIPVELYPSEDDLSSYHDGAYPLDGYGI